ncbi:hypothetical protein C1646_812168 [Rhizophagus diaphanus]|nr:hypothetical protein C1646_812168 [Rhizophagus diaphanus] [Rhizophagus sp. MUCL 43196]
MACSKLFSGYLPELIDEIIQYLRNDILTLHSCILVNRLWCRSAISLLWEDPFSLNPDQNFQHFEIYFHCLNEDDKAKLNEYGINNNLLLSSTLFNYPSFIKRLNTHTVSYSIENWHSTLKVHHNHQEASKLIYRLLFKMFIENEGSLDSFEIKVTSKDNYSYFNDTMELVLQNPNFICNVRNLMISITARRGYSRHIRLPEKTFAFIKFLHSNCNSISSFSYKFSDFYVNNRTLFGKCLSQMIITQQNLKKISFECDNYLYNSFSLLQTSNISNTLKIITFYSIDFRIIIINFQEIFNQLNVLESIHIINCDSLNSEIAQQIINVTKPFKLKTLIMYHDTLQVESLQLLLQKFGNDLECFKFGYYESYKPEQKNQLLKSIVKYCTKIKYFDLGKPDDISINLVFNLIENIKQNLNYLIIEYNFRHCSVIYGDICSNILNNLGQVLPSELEFLRLCLYIEPSNLKIFLENSQNTFIRRLFIRNLYEKKGEDILPYIKEYIMKKKRVKYLAVYDYQDLIFLKDEVNEFKLHNIRIESYINSYDIRENFKYCC